MQLSRQNNDDRTLRHAELVQIHRDAAGALLYINDLHLLVPVQRHGLEIERYCTNICNKRKVDLAVSLFLLIILVLCYIHAVSP